jgi:hypothetical protein
MATLVPAARSMTVRAEAALDVSVPSLDRLPNAAECHNRPRASIIEHTKVVRSQINERLIQFTVDRDGDGYLVNRRLECLSTMQSAKAKNDNDEESNELVQTEYIMVLQYCWYHQQVVRCATVSQPRAQIPSCPSCGSGKTLSVDGNGWGQPMLFCGTCGHMWSGTEPPPPKKVPSIFSKS